MYGELAQWVALLTRFIGRLSHMVLHALYFKMEYFNIFLKTLEAFEVEFLVCVTKANHLKLNMFHEL